MEPSLLIVVNPCLLKWRTQIPDIIHVWFLMEMSTHYHVKLIEYGMIHSLCIREAPCHFKPRKIQMPHAYLGRGVLNCRKGSLNILWVDPRNKQERVFHAGIKDLFCFWIPLKARITKQTVHGVDVIGVLEIGVMIAYNHLQMILRRHLIDQWSEPM